MKWPCRECIVRPRCSQECPAYKSFRNYMMNVVSPILLLFSTILAAVIMIYLVILNDYYTCSGIFIGGSWAMWAITQDQDSLFLTVMSPALLPGFIVMRLLARKYKRA